MGYGHLRAAHALTEHLGVALRRVDASDLADPVEVREWERLRRGYEGLSRATDWPVVGGVARSLLDRMTRLGGNRAAPATPDMAVRRLHRRFDAGLGAGMVRHLRASGEQLVSTFYAPALAAAHAGIDDAVCVVTDVDVHRIWAPLDPARSPHYCVPAAKTRARLRSYGVPPERIHVTGFPLPADLLGGPDLGRLRSVLARRLARLDPNRRFLQPARAEILRELEHLPREPSAPPRLVFTVGGAGAQVRQVRRFLTALAPLLHGGEVRLTVAVGTHADLAERVREIAETLGIEGDRFELLHVAGVEPYLVAFRELLARTDALFTKPSEMSFYAALGVPLVLTTPLGAHERANRRWLLRREAALRFDRGDDLAASVRYWIASGALARVAWYGFRRLPKRGTYRIGEFVGN